jgi:hypothetical protein
MSTHAARRARRMPAPLLLVTVPGGLAVRKVRERRKVAAVERRAEERLERALDRRLPAAPAEAATSPIIPPATTSVPTVGQGADGIDRAEAVQGWVYAHRRDVLAPIAVALVLAVLRHVVHLAGGYNVWSLAVVGLPVTAVLVAGAWWARQVDPRDVSLKTRWAAWGTVVVGLLWMLSPAKLPLTIWPHELTVVPGLPHGTDWALWAGWTGAAVWGRWGRFKVRPVEVPVVGPVETWAATLGAEGTSAGTVLRRVERVISRDGEDIGWQGDVHCVWGKHNVTKVMTWREDIAGAFDRDIQDVVIERTGNALRARLAVMERPPFPKEMAWTGPTLTLDGVSTLGSYFDGDPAQMRLWTPGAGTHDAWFFGVKGAGKSVAVDNALGSWMSMGLVVLHMVDLKGGMSLSQWQEVAFRYGTKAADGLMLLRRLDAIGTARMEAAAKMRWYAPGDPVERVGVPVLEPSAEWPIHLGVIEEAPQLWRIPEAVKIAERIMTLYRAVLVSLCSISQMCELKQAWGNSATLRTQVQGGNVWCGYVPKEQAKLGFDHFRPDLTLITKGSYLSYVTSPVLAREALMRVARIKDSWAVARASRPGVPNAIDLAAVQEAEARAAREAEADAAEPGDTNSGSITHAQIERVVRSAVQDAGGPVKLAVILSALAPKGMDDLTRQRFDNLIGKKLKDLVEDPTSAVTKPRFGEYGVAS